jgi:hypothetical protein
MSYNLFLFLKNVYFFIKKNVYGFEPRGWATPNEPRGWLKPPPRPIGGGFGHPLLMLFQPELEESYG